MKRIVVLTGAGISAESGISTFRDSDGLWEKYPVQQVASIEGFRENPQLVLDFYTTRRKELLQCLPNEAHKTLARLEEKWHVDIITQNVDNLHEQAGSSRVLHLHGELMKNCSVANTQKTYPVDPDNLELKVGDLAPDGHQLRPFIVWFGEAVPMIEPAIKLVQEADIFVVIGTSLNVYPAASLLQYAPKESLIFIIDPKPVPYPHGLNIEFISTVATEGTKILEEKLRSLE
ncbi:SIR2 family NAD-dependent protein deacylase [Porphyromonas gingivicanis]|uniref:SIR2 family NAD-dependent protein deacylase n=1 Tax=Porphyromonas gingivicanis TaxID=266762 RepID=UPI00046EE304|nr:Sir2 family NAD-dependent protein deacetylase [Porphyromonas gingivicanis]